VDQAFPTGARETAIIARLRQEGFAPGDFRPRPDGLRRAVFNRDDLVCSQGAEISWRADGTGGIRDLASTLHPPICL
jgi:hypothetical protein